MTVSWGFEYGSKIIKIVKLTRSKTGAVETEQFSTPIHEFLNIPGLKDHVTVSITGRLTLARNVKLPPVEEKRIPDIIRYEADQMIPFDMDEVNWFYYLVPDNGLDREANILAVKKELIGSELKKFEELGFGCVNLVQTTTVAIFNCLSRHGFIGSTGDNDIFCYEAMDQTGVDVRDEIEAKSKEEALAQIRNRGLFPTRIKEKIKGGHGTSGSSTVILNIDDDESTDLIITDGSSFWTRTIPIGVKSITDAVAKGFKVSEDHAIRICTDENHKYHKQLSEIIYPIFNDLIQEVNRSIGFYQSTHRESKVTGLRIVGTSIPLLSKYLAAKMKDLVFLETPEKIATHCVAHGLALQGIGEAKITGDFLGGSKKSGNQLAEAAVKVISGIQSLLRISLIESVVVVAIIALLISILIPSIQASKKQADLDAIINATAGVDTTPVPVVTDNPHATIRIETFPDGSVKVSPVFDPPFSDTGNNPLSHTMAKKMLEQ